MPRVWNATRRRRDRKAARIRTIRMRVANEKRAAAMSHHPAGRQLRVVDTTPGPEEAA